ncbi:Dot/Icm T4SS effector Ceg17 [Legionella saoudiensis]|uniref:Dot/Icm T4SS effector Ceg17 n=1 Tax=Legionella saoudiensis TaxID=1750561 RepID=UPI000730FBE9|nr:Dot/Icm T4SS effector Ceg17 [Legionella saoudiensis]
MPTIYEQMLEGKNDYDGVNLSYHGARFIDSSFSNGSYIADDSSLTPLQAFTERFKNIGALLIRFHLGQGQRGGLLQQLTRSNYAENPVERPAKGGDDSAVFFKEDVQSTENILEFLSHQPLGRSKVLNERAQPLLHVNKAGVYGEQGLWDILHAPVWNVGRAMKFELKKQGFIYLACPPGMSSNDRAFLAQRLTTSGLPYQQVFDEQGLSATTGEISKLSYVLDDKNAYTQEENGLAIGLNNKDYAPLGWIVHAETGEILPQGITEEIIRVSAIAEGGFYEKSKRQQQILQSGYLKNTNGLGLFRQNQAFNAMYVIFDYLQKYNFDPRPLLDGSLLAMNKRVNDLVQKDPSVIDDFLTGALQDEMVQPLRVSQPKSKRSVLPLRFTNPFEVTLNNLKGIAYAFNLKDNNNEPIFREYDDSPIISQADELIDNKVNGALVAPSFSTGGHVAAILSTAELVAEQMILEQLLPEAFVNKDALACLLSLLVKCLGQEKGQKLLDDLFEEAAKVPQADNKPICGLQFEYCNKLVQVLRQGLGLDKLQSLLAQFAKPGVSTQEVLEGLTQEELLGLSANLKVLFIAGTMLQKSPLTSAQSEHSRGINAGLEPLIACLNPHLAQELEIASESIERATVFPVDKGVVKDRLSTQIFTQCPFLSGQVKKQKEVINEVSVEHTATPQNTGYSFFNTLWNNKGTILAASVSAAVVVGGIMLNQ